MFEWNVEEMKLMTCASFINGKRVFSQDHDVSRNDKIEFIDKMKDGIMTYAINLISKFETDRENGLLKEDSYGHVKTVSLKAWIKKHDPKHIVDDWYHYGKMYLFGSERYINHQPLTKSGYSDYYEDLVDECFRRVLVDLEKEEVAYFKAHDEYEVLKKRVEDYISKYHTTFGLCIGTGSDLRLYKNDWFAKGRHLTIDELKLLVSQYEKIDDIIENANIKIEF